MQPSILEINSIRFYDTINSNHWRNENHKQERQQGNTIKKTHLQRFGVQNL
jgi:hypothetical protein